MVVDSECLTEWHSCLNVICPSSVPILVNFWVCGNSSSDDTITWVMFMSDYLSYLWGLRKFWCTYDNSSSSNKIPGSFSVWAGKWPVWGQHVSGPFGRFEFWWKLRYCISDHHSICESYTSLYILIHTILSLISQEFLSSATTYIEVQILGR